MHVAITGAAGFLGRRLARGLVEHDGGGGTGPLPGIERLTLLDSTGLDAVPDGAKCVVGDLAAPDTLDALFADPPDLIFHLAAVVSAAAEADFDLGMRVNLDASRALIERARVTGNAPRLVFASSVAVFGAVPDGVDDDTPATPMSSYGTQKAMVELLLSDASRRGFVDGRTFRLPTVVVRPGKPNQAASSFASSIIREPLQGQEAVCPVDPSLRLWILSPRRVIDALMHGAGLGAEVFGDRRIVNLPGLSVTVADMVDALRREGGNADLIRWERDRAIERIVETWPGHMRTPLAVRLGFKADDGMAAIVRAFIEDDLAPRA